MFLLLCMDYTCRENLKLSSTINQGTVKLLYLIVRLQKLYNIGQELCNAVTTKAIIKCIHSMWNVYTNSYRYHYMHANHSCIHRLQTIITCHLQNPQLAIYLTM